MYNYKTKSGLQAFIPGVGQTDEDGLISVAEPLESPALELVSHDEPEVLEGELIDHAPASPEQPQIQAPAPEQPAPNQVTEGTL